MDPTKLTSQRTPMFDAESSSNNGNEFTILPFPRDMKLSPLLVEKCDHQCSLLNEASKEHAPHAAGHDNKSVDHNIDAPYYFGDDDNNTSNDTKNQEEVLKGQMKNISSKL